jgi:hypothetical protein
MLLPLLIAACWTPKETSATGMVGHVLDADGAPLPGLIVETEEARSETDAHGRFAVSYKSPTQFAFFEHQGVRFTRRYQPGDDGQVIDLRLPRLTQRRFSCEMDTTCEAVLTWEVAPGLEAQVRSPCDATESQVAFLAPEAGLPTKAVCRPPTGPEQPLRAIEASPLYPPAHIRLTPPWVQLQVKLSTTELPLPHACTVFADGQPAQLDGEGRWLVSAFGRVMLHAECDRIPGTPRMVVVRNPGETTLSWHPTTPALDARAQAPGATKLRVITLAGRDRGWSLELDAAADGTFTLPRLGAGLFAFGFGATIDDLLRLRPAEDLAPGVLHLTEVPDDRGQPLRVGLLKLDAELTEGSLPISVRPK